MIEAGFVRAPGRSGIPRGYANGILSGESTYKAATKARQDQADALAIELHDKFELDKIARKAKGC